MDTIVYAHAPREDSLRPLHLDIGRGFRVRAGRGHAPIVRDAEWETCLVECVGEGIDRAVACPRIVLSTPSTNTAASTEIRRAPSTSSPPMVLRLSERDPSFTRYSCSKTPHMVSGRISVPFSRKPLDEVRQLGMHLRRQDHAVFFLHDVGYAALPRLAVDADDGLIAPSHVRRIDREIGDLPVIAAPFL